MNLLCIPWVLISALGAVALAASSYLILSGPFGGGTSLPGDVLILSIIVFMAGLITFTYGGTKTARIVLRF